MLGECTVLDHLDLSNNHIRAEGAGRLAGGLGECKVLAHLAWQGNQVWVVLGESKALAHLDLGCNEIWGRGSSEAEGGAGGARCQLILPCKAIWWGC